MVIDPNTHFYEDSSETKTNNWKKISIPETIKVDATSLQFNPASWQVVRDFPSLDRIADALERIADVLEKEHE